MNGVQRVYTLESIALLSNRSSSDSSTQGLGTSLAEEEDSNRQLHDFLFACFNFIYFFIYFEKERTRSYVSRKDLDELLKVKVYNQNILYKYIF